ncbi:hypothetical protein [Thauera aromatica]|nr:hypothetical protein [Thauera aromatica]
MFNDDGIGSDGIGGEAQMAATQPRGMAGGVRALRGKWSEHPTVL